ncbi:putative transcription factor B3-Domain family [Helianthus annuus]|nr:putative transcription factor B3-Domain family [Helianthus annuus]
MNQTISLDKTRKNTHKHPWESKPQHKQIIVMSDKQPQKTSGRGKRTRVCDIYNNAEDQYMCLERAGMLLERLGTALPTFAKCMLPSNVAYSFWLFLPSKFCIMHLPEHDTTVTLVDESGTEFKTKYLKARHGLSGGWKGFSFAQKLLPGDILFFHLVGTCKLQVHIVRRYGIEAVEAAVCLMEMHPRVKRKRALTSEKLKHEKVKVKVKGKRAKRYPKKRVMGSPTWRFAQMNTDEDGARCDDTSNAFSSNVVEGSSSNDSQHDQRGCGAPNLCYENGINCGSAAQRIYCPTVAN